MLVTMYATIFDSPLGQWLPLYGSLADLQINPQSSGSTKSRIFPTPLLCIHAAVPWRFGSSSHQFSSYEPNGFFLRASRNPFTFNRFTTYFHLFTSHLSDKFMVFQKPVIGFQVKRLILSSFSSFHKAASHFDHFFSSSFPTFLN